MTDVWHALRIDPAGHRDAVLAALFAAGAQAVEERGQELVTQFPAGALAESVAGALRDIDASVAVAVSEAPAVDWTERWKDSVRAHDLGALTVGPPWLCATMDPARTVVIEPAMAFGTGEHATTRGVMRLMPAVIRAGDRVADLGAGSAVLAIAAAKLGAARAVAIELDPDAIGNAEENVAANGVADRVTVIEGDAGVLLPLVAPADLVVANIISGVLVPMLPVIRESLAPGGRAILSGILRTEREDMLRAIADARWVAGAEDSEDAWWSVVITPA